MNIKRIEAKLEKHLGYKINLKMSLAGTLVAKVVSLLFALLFMKLRGTAKANGKVCKSRIFLALAVLFFIGVFTNTALVPDKDADGIEACDCDDFEEDAL
jgi:putative exporter of polyketide antibiotics